MIPEEQHLADLAAYERGEPTENGIVAALPWAKAKLAEGPVDEELAALVLRVEMKVFENLGGAS